MPRMAWLLLPFGLAAGAALTVQFSVNSQLRDYAGGPLVAATISFLVGTVALTAVSLATRQEWRVASAISRAPVWIWVGGLLGGFYVLATIILLPRLGAATTVGLILAGQVIASLVIDHFGWIRVPVHELNLPRLTGAALIVLGVALVQRF